MLLDPIISHARDKADKTAVIDDRGTMTYGELYAKARKLAKVIRRQTSKPHVGILLPAGGGFVTAFYATLLAGKIPVPVNFLLGKKETRHVLADADVDLVVTVQIMLDKLDAGAAVAEAAGVKVLDLLKLKPSFSTVFAQIFPLPSPRRSPGELATILYTSGTSGMPKGVELTHGNLHEDVWACIRHARLEQRDASEADEHMFLGIVPLFHSTGLLATMLVPMTLGVKVVYTARFSPQQTVKAIREHKVSVMAAVPSMYNAIARLKEAKPSDFAQMSIPLSGGEPLPGRVRELFKEKFECDLMEGYGLTETCGPASVNMPHAHRPGSVGQPLPGVEVRIAGDDDRPLPQGDTGEIQLRGPMVFRGYHNLDDQTAAVKTRDDFFRTGDLGHVDEDGYLFVTGRKKDMLIVSGENVYPREIEELVATMPGVAECAVIGRPDESRGEVPIAFVILADPSDDTPAVTGEDVKRFCREQGLPNYKVPRDVTIETELPRSPTGKVLKRELVKKLETADAASA